MILREGSYGKYAVTEGYIFSSSLMVDLCIVKDIAHGGCYHGGIN